MIALIVSASSSLAQKDEPHRDAEKLPEMQITDAGLLAIDTPKGFKRVDGPGLASFVPERELNKKQPGVLIYVSCVPIGPSESNKDFESAIEADINAFKTAYKSGSVKKEEDLDLPRAKHHAPRYTMMSGQEKNGFEQIVFIDDGERVLILVLSTRNQTDFARSLPTFQGFARSYGGSVILGPKVK